LLVSNATAPPDEGFRALTRAVWSAFPDFPPYGGAFTEIVQHLTIGTDGNRTRRNTW
jgi:hypothetical protein